VAQGVGTAEIVPSGQDVFGGHLFALVDYSGPKNYIQGGDIMDPRFFGFDNTIITLFGTLDTTQTFRLEPKPVYYGIVTAWRLVWTVYSTGQEASSGLNLSSFTGRLTALGF
jgi:hypothetical protein